MAIVAVGLAACTVVYAILDHFFLKPLPFPHAERLIAIYSASPETRANSVGNDVERPAWKELSANGAFEGIGGWSRRVEYWGYPAEDIISSWYASSSLFEVLGIRPAIGRLFTPAEDTTSSDVALVSWECWQRRLGGRPDILSQTITTSDAFVSGAPPEVKKIVGVLPTGFKLHGDPPEVVFPIGRILPNVGSFYLVARLATGVQLDAAQNIAGSVLAATSQGPNVTRARVMPLRQALAAELVPPVWMLIAVAGVLLAVTAVSAAGLLLNDLLSRRQEFSVRLSLGADQVAIGRELIVEQALRSALAAVASVGLAYLLLRLITSAAPADLMGSARPGIDYRILLWGLCGSTVASLLLGIVPVMYSVVKSTNLAIPGSGHLLPHRLRVQKATATLQLSMSFVLLVCATLLGRTLINLTSKPIGFDASNMAVISFKTSVYPQVVAPAGVWPVFASWTHTDGLLEAVNRIPGVVNSAAVSSAPFGGGARTTRVRRDASSVDTFEVEGQNVTKDYWKTLGVPILAGRGLEAQDRRRDTRQTDFRIVVSRALDRILGGNSVGRHFVSANGRSTYEIVGVVGDAKQHSLADQEIPVMYSLSATFDGVRSILVRTSRAPEQLLPAISRAVRDYDRSVLITKISTMSSLVADSAAAERFRASLAIVIGAITIGLAAFGMFLLGLRFVDMRRREIGLRLALGATSNDVLRTVLRDTAQIVGAGMAIGWPASYVAARALQGFFFGVSWFDPVSLLLDALILIAATAVAMAGPAVRALKIDPALALRQ